MEINSSDKYLPFLFYYYLMITNIYITINPPNSMPYKDKEKERERD